MKAKRKICKTCKAEQLIWKNGNCRSCSSKLNPPKSIKKFTSPFKKKKSYIPKLSEKGKIKKEEKKEWLNELHQWELLLWDSLEDKNGYIYCYETRKPMHKSIYKENLCVYSHCLPKSKYPEYAMEKWNLLIVLPEIHSLWETNPQKCHKMWTYTEKLKEKYG